MYRTENFGLITCLQMKLYFFEVTNSGACIWLDPVTFCLPDDIMQSLLQSYHVSLKMGVVNKYAMIQWMELSALVIMAINLLMKRAVKVWLLSTHSFLTLT